MKQLKDSEILENVIKALKLSKNSFSKALNYQSSMTIYNITNNQNSQMSDDMINRIRVTFPNVSFLYLTKGEGNPLTSEVGMKNQSNIFDTNFETPNPIKDVAQINLRIGNIENILQEMLQHFKEKKE